MAPLSLQSLFSRSAEDEYGIVSVSSEDVPSPTFDDTIPSATMLVPSEETDTVPATHEETAKLFMLVEDVQNRMDFLQRLVIFVVLVLVMVGTAYGIYKMVSFYFGRLHRSETPSSSGLNVPTPDMPTQKSTGPLGRSNLNASEPVNNHINTNKDEEKQPESPSNASLPAYSLSKHGLAKHLSWETLTLRQGSR